MIIDIASCDDHFGARTTRQDWQRITAFRHHPNFLNGVRHYANSMLPFFATSKILNKVIVEAWRFQMLALTLWLYETMDPDDPRSGLTVANLQRLCADLGLASPGRVFALIQIMRAGRFLEVAPCGPDRRVKRFLPTPKFMGSVEEWNGNILAAIDSSQSNSHLTDLAARLPNLKRGMRTRGAQGLIDGWDPLLPFPEVKFFSGFDGGYPLMIYVARQAIGNDGLLRTGPINVDLRKRANSFGGSRTNLANLLDRAYTEGMLSEPHSMGSHVVFAPRTICSFLGFVASYLSNFEIHALAASVPDAY